MSFTVMHHKDGKVIPIKMSIWDAFKGVPKSKPQKQKPKSKPKPCPCCNKVHAVKDTEGTAGHDNEDNEADTGKAAEKADPKKSKEAEQISKSTRPDETYTAKDNKKIIELKEAGATWAKILETIHKESVSQLKAHWKTIDPSKKDESTKDTKKNEGSEATTQKDKEKQAKIEKQKAEGQAKKKEREGKKGKSVYVEDKKDPENTIPCENEIKAFASRYDKQKWIAAASRHYDLTGQRITTAMARKMAEGK